ncbi:citrate (pro-3S)-lyase subunit beta [Rugosimonospora acidiphila]|uniref:Citrate (Pro-3S)-lyase subunit beta n=1 Tax=Rugosimonospora acidiphila TaxID=556531 RepID=A0ABP9S2S5_9ACTN
MTGPDAAGGPVPAGQDAPLPDGPAWLFCPADRPERFDKAAAAADVVILDLEDGVAPGARPEARRALRHAAVRLDPARTVVRISPLGTPDHDADRAALRDLPLRTVMLAKTESAAQVATLSGLRVVALCETPAGVREAAAIAEVSDALMWGAEDLIAGLGGSSSRRPDGRYRDVARHARAVALIAAGAAGIPALDSVYLDLDDLDGLAAEATDAVESGFAAKVCVHPRQVPVVRRAFAPTAQQLEAARRIVEAAGSRPGVGVFALDGRMVDEPLIRQARRLLSRAASSTG